MKKILLLLILLLLIKIAFSQNVAREIDSLAHLLKTTKEDSTKVNILNTLSKRLWLSGLYNLSMENANEALLLGNKINFKKGVANAYNNMGVVNIEQANYQQALKNYLIALNIRVEIGDKLLIGYSYINIGNVYLQEGNYPEALKNYLTAMKIGEQNNNMGVINNSYSSIGNVYAQQGNYSEALKNYFAALKRGPDPHGQIIIHDNIGEIYIKQGKYNEALKIFLDETEPRGKYGDSLSLANSYTNIGNIYLLQGKYSYALKNYLAALGIQKKLGYRYGIADSYIHLGKIYFQLNNQPQAKDYLDKGLLLAKDAGSKDEIKDAYYVLSELDSLTGNMDKAYRYYRLYAEMRDSIINEKSNKQISQLNIQYESDKKDRQIETQDFQLKTQTLQNKILQTRIYYGAAFGLFIILLFYLRSQRKRREFENQIVLLELSLLKSQLNPHFIFNCLHSIKAYIDTNPQTGSDYLNRFSLLMRGVLEKSEEKEISLSEEMQLMVHYIELEKMRLSGRLNYSITFDPSVNREETMIPPLITQPVIENAIWHGVLPGDKSREINIHSTVSGKILTIIVTNNAVSQPATKPSPAKRKSFGIKITRERLALLKKTIGTEGALVLEILPEETKVTITIPLKEF